eukprot:Awhi_evm2s8010
MFSLLLSLFLVGVVQSQTITYFTVILSTRSQDKLYLIGNEPFFGNLTACQNQCEITSDCVLFNYNTIEEYCYLMNADGETRFYDGYNRYIKHVVDAAAPIDGQWGAWSASTVVSGTTCSDNIGEKTRVCDNPPPSNGGVACSGESKETIISNCIEDVYSRTESTRADNNANVMELYEDATVGQCQARCSALEACLNFDHNLQYSYCYMHSVSAGTKKSVRYSRYIKFTVDTSKDSNGSWGSWSEWKEVPGEQHCSKKFKQRTRIVGNATETEQSKCFYGLPDLASYPDTFVEHTGIKSNSLGTYVQINNIDLNTCKRYALIRQSDPVRAVDYDHRQKICYIQEKEFYMAGNITSNANFTHFELKNVPYPNLLPMPGPYVDVQKTFAKHTSSSPQIFNVTTDESITVELSVWKLAIVCLLVIYHQPDFASSIMEEYETDFSYHTINDLMAFGFDENYQSYISGRSVPFFSNVIHEINDYGRCFFQNATTEQAMLSTEDTSFYYYELDTNFQRVDQDEKSEALHCPEGVSCTGVFEKFEDSRSQFMWENIIFQFYSLGVDECKQACVEKENCVALDYDFVDRNCYLKGYSHAVVKDSNYLHFKLTARQVPTPDESEGSLSKTILIIIIACSTGGFVLFIIACLIGLKIYKKKQQDLLDGMTPKEYVLQNGGNGKIDLISDEDYQKSKEFIGDPSLDTYLDTLVVVNEKKGIPIPEASENYPPLDTYLDTLVVIP